MIKRKLKNPPILFKILKNFNFSNQYLSIHIQHIIMYRDYLKLLRVFLIKNEKI